MSVPNPPIPEPVADSQPWTQQTWAQSTPGPQTPSSGNGLVTGNNVQMAWQDTAVTPNRWFRLIDTASGFILQTGTGATMPSSWTTLWQITDVTQSTIYEVLTALTRDSRNMGAPGAVGAAPFSNRIFVGSDAQPRYTQGTAGDMAWGPGGSTVTDTFLARTSAGVVGITGKLNQTGSPSIASDLTTKSYTDTADNLRLLLAGGTMTGALNLAADPTVPLGAATKQYVDTHSSNLVTFSGAGAPTSSTLAASINYVVGNEYWDTTNLILYVCKTAGTNTTSTWAPADQVFTPSSVTLQQTTANYTLQWNNPAAGRIITIPDPGGADTFAFLAAAQVLTGKTYDTAGAGNVLKINGTQVSAVTGTGAVVLAAAPSFTSTISVGTTAQTGTANRFRMLQSMARVRNSAAESIPNSVETILTWNTEDYNTDGMHSIVSNTSRLTAPITGKYRIYGIIEFDPNANGQRYVRLYVNGVASEILAGWPVATATIAADLGFSIDKALNANDYVEVAVWQNTGGALNVASTAVRTLFGMSYIGE